MRIEDLVLSGAGNRVYAERLDHFCASDGTIILTVRALGVRRDPPASVGVKSTRAVGPVSST